MSIATTNMAPLIHKAAAAHYLTRDELELILNDDGCNDALFRAADKVRRQYVGDEVHLRGLIEFSNICRQNCCYCGLRRDNPHVRRYRLAEDTIVDFAAKAASYGYRTVVLQSGEDEYFTVERICSVVRRIKEFGLAITLSIGEKSFAEYQAYREAGADRYLLRIETTDRQLYEDLDPGMELANRVRCLDDLRTLGYEVGTGCLVGLPGQTMASLADDILYFRALDADMIGIGPFIPHPDTPLAAAKGGDVILSMKVMALIRLLLPYSNIPATTAMETLHPNGRILALQSGANVVMPNVTEGEYRQWYQLYPGKICVNDTPAHCRSCITGKIAAIGRPVATTHGFRQRNSSHNAI
ncbi:[FeFe] hydrogenase H-cluster radical SAM maturase HydE [Acetonema longum]|uniref:Biotin synthase n=1 Tax=Acetonema longum DSM 6540 TaxID=1009370 RepID=F7NGH0_9FIRM|nr:[FeFe] hydrogenase H-cluster radical SAM maturase HydE [Acetonema longum]EGO64774.1 biotin synthase [Acetonema longum DSM 6540]